MEVKGKFEAKMFYNPFFLYTFSMNALKMLHHLWIGLSYSQTQANTAM